MNPRTKLNLMLSALAVSACLIAVTLAGCGKGDDSPRSDSLRVGIGTDVRTWHFDQFPGGDSRFVWSQVYETLCRLSPDLELKPGLATTWESSDGGRVWTFQLRAGVKFHDGSELTAQAVVFSYSEQASSRRTVLRSVEKVEALNSRTVRFYLKRAMPLPYYPTHVGWPVMGAGSLAEEGAFRAPVGTGPYRFQKHVPDERVVLEAFEDYWGGEPAVEQVVFRVLPSATTRVMALESGELDMVVKVQESDVPRLENRGDVTVHRTLSTFTDFLQFNCRREPLDQLVVRRAVARAIDTTRLTRTVLEGVGEPARGRPYCPRMLYADPDLELIEHDPEAARRLLSGAGWEDGDGDDILEKGGTALELTLLVSQNANVGVGGRFFMMAEVIQQALRRVGIDVNIRQLESGAFLRAENRGEFDMLLRTGFYVWGPYPRHFFLHSLKNPYNHCDMPQLDDLIRRADAAPTESARRSLYRKLQREVVGRLPAFYLTHQEKVVATGPRVAGYRITAEPPWLNLSGIRLTKTKRPR